MDVQLFFKIKKCYVKVLPSPVRWPYHKFLNFHNISLPNFDTAFTWSFIEICSFVKITVMVKSVCSKINPFSFCRANDYILRSVQELNFLAFFFSILLFCKLQSIKHSLIWSLEDTKYLRSSQSGLEPTRCNQGPKKSGSILLQTDLRHFFNLFWFLNENPFTRADRSNQANSISHDKKIMIRRLRIHENMWWARY